MSAVVAVLACVTAALGIVVMWLALDSRETDRRVRELGWRTGFLMGALTDEERTAMEAKIAEYMRGQFGDRAMSDPRSKL